VRKWPFPLNPRYVVFSDHCLAEALILLKGNICSYKFTFFLCLCIVLIAVISREVTQIVSAHHNFLLVTYHNYAAALLGMLLLGFLLKCILRHYSCCS
jgi:hypothetical protein